MSTKSPEKRNYIKKIIKEYKDLAPELSEFIRLERLNEMP